MYLFIYRNLIIINSSSISNNSSIPMIAGVSGSMASWASKHFPPHSLSFIGSLSPVRRPLQLKPQPLPSNWRFALITDTWAYIPSVTPPPWYLLRSRKAVHPATLLSLSKWLHKYVCSPVYTILPYIFGLCNKVRPLFDRFYFDLAGYLATLLNK